MRLAQPERVPLMCQLSLGHYFLNAGIDPLDIWHSTEGFGEALLRLQRRYGFDGILINLPGREPNWRSHIRKIEQRDGEQIIHWNDGRYTVLPLDDNPHIYQSDGKRFFPAFASVDPEKLSYFDPHVTPGSESQFWPPWQMDTIRYVLERAVDVSVHGEIFSPFSQFLEMLDFENGLVALLDDSGKAKACLEALCAGAIDLACRQASAGVHAVLMSSAFAGAGFLSRQHYGDFVLPYERRVIAGIKARFDIPVYTHTCGAIGDRLDLMMDTGTNGIDTLDPPPLGTVELADAKSQTAGRLFLKGNLDPVNTLLQGSRDTVRTAAQSCLRDAAAGGGYILSSACSVAPRTPPENLLVLREIVEKSPDLPHAGCGGRERL